MGYYGTLMLYLGIIITTTLLTKIAYSPKCNKMSKIVLVGLAVFVAALFAGLRYQVGADWAQYYNGVEYVGKQGNVGWGDNKENYGLGYILICKFIYLIGGNGSFLLFVMAFLTYAFLYLMLDRLKDDIDVSISIFFYTSLYYLVSFNIVRQALGITIGMYAISFLDLEMLSGNFRYRAKHFLFNNVKYIFWSIISVSVHNAGYICFLAMPLCYFMRKKRFRWFALIAVLLAVLNYQNFMNLAISLTGIDVFRWYFRLWGEQGSYLLYILKYAPFVLTCGFAYESLKKNKRIFDMYNLFLIGLIINALSVKSNSEVERICFVFLYMLIIVVPYSLKHIDQSHCFFSLKIRINAEFYTFYRIFIYTYAIFFLYYYFFLSGSYKVVPYNFIQ